MTKYELRLFAVKRYLASEKSVNIYTSLNRSKSWFFKWLKLYLEYGEAGLKDRSKRPLVSPNKTIPEVEQLVINIRKRLIAHATRETFYAPIGADSISWELDKLGVGKLPSTRTIDRILKRNGLVGNSDEIQKHHRILYPNLPVNAPNDVHQLDPVGPRYIKGLTGVEKFFSINLIDCFSKMVVLRQHDNVRNLTIVEFLIKNVWPEIGLSKVL